MFHVLCCVLNKENKQPPQLVGTLQSGLTLLVSFHVCSPVFVFPARVSSGRSSDPGRFFLRLEENNWTKWLEKFLGGGTKAACVDSVIYTHISRPVFSRMCHEP